MAQEAYTASYCACTVDAAGPILSGGVSGAHHAPAFSVVLVVAPACERGDGPGGLGVRVPLRWQRIWGVGKDFGSCGTGRQAQTKGHLGP